MADPLQMDRAVVRLEVREAGLPEGWTGYQVSIRIDDAVRFLITYEDGVETYLAKWSSEEFGIVEPDLEKQLDCVRGGGDQAAAAAKHLVDGWNERIRSITAPVLTDPPWWPQDGWKTYSNRATFPQFERDVERMRRMGTLPKSPPADGASMIMVERNRQIVDEGWTAEHDDCHVGDQLAEAAMCYAAPDRVDDDEVPAVWPWGDRWWKPTPDDRVRELVKAGALIAAEIDRLKRLEGK